MSSSLLLTRPSLLRILAAPGSDPSGDLLFPVLFVDPDYYASAPSSFWSSHRDAPWVQLRVFIHYVNALDITTLYHESYQHAASTTTTFFRHYIPSRRVPRWRGELLLAILLMGVLPSWLYSSGNLGARPLPRTVFDTNITLLSTPPRPRFRFRPLLSRSKNNPRCISDCPASISGIIRAACIAILPSFKFVSPPPLLAVSPPLPWCLWSSFLLFHGISLSLSSLRIRNRHVLLLSSALGFRQVLPVRPVIAIAFVSFNSTSVPTVSRGFVKISVVAIAKHCSCVVPHIKHAPRPL
ncbi:hypothetical protein R3P38DRAFT_3211733 [Favolaschia claudopus]|uniref:Uncharacterized protein n=1 Tax=Favolaschia claudopus TaxID=2862362 RepID=A0AAW0AG83_9AGAR